ncbi:MAG TPA: DUF6790 family protein [Steroidobacteraceae bacterium]|nr:DUF6790 family protein [Steroidobacteraceae bacterium]
MYYIVVATLMFAFPLLSVGIEASTTGASIDAALIGKWFVFWAVGCRLFLAGMRQIVQPGYTARVILGLEHAESQLVVRELGFANVAIGCIGIASLFMPSWRLAGALAGGIFYGLAGVNHTVHAHRNRLENVAMVSDLCAALVLLWVCVAVI